MSAISRITEKDTIIKSEEEVSEEQDTSLILDNQYIFIQLPSGNIKVVKLQKDT
jgi:hypothetical protein